MSVCKINRCVWGCFFLVLLFQFISISSKAQEQPIKADSTKTNRHSPLRATIFSAVVPGLGQAYNNRYWKIPIIYSAAGSLIYFTEYHRKKLDVYSYAYNYVDLPGPVKLYYGDKTSEQLKLYKDFYKRNYDLMRIIIAGVYLLNILDATVDAHMYDFDISDDLSLKIVPSAEPCFANSNYMVLGVRCYIHF